jgi:ABC-type nitrate/sulfonate/bicarbonate transport system substrate-binding protein
MQIRIVLAAVLLIAGLAVDVHAQKPELTEIDAWLVRDLQMSSQFAVADKMGYFQAEGIKVNPRW